jgi:hypothetical protein
MYPKELLEVLLAPTFHTSTARGGHARLRDVCRLVAEEPSERSAESKSRPLHPGGRKRQSHQVELLFHDHREPKRVGQALLVGLGV